MVVAFAQSTTNPFSGGITYWRIDLFKGPERSGTSSRPYNAPSVKILADGLSGQFIVPMGQCSYRRVAAPGFSHSGRSRCWAP